jgi:hypothetical protein
MKNPKAKAPNPDEARSLKTETSLRTARSVLACGGPPPLFHCSRCHPATQSARGLAHSRTWRTLLTCCLLNAGLGLPVLAQYAIPWHAIDRGGGTSTGGVYSVSVTIGQPDAGPIMTNGQYAVTGGFLALPTAIQTPGAPTLSIAPATPGNATLSWTPDTPGWILQETWSLSPANWTNSASGSTHPITVPATPPMRFYRLFKP